MTRSRLFLTLALLTLALASCSSQPDPAPSGATPPPASTAAPTPSTPTLTISGRKLVAALKQAGLPVTQVRCYTDADDPNHLLGRPGQYVDRCAWRDKRIEDYDPASTKTEGPGTDIGGSIELFETPGGPIQREEYIEGFGALSAEWHWAVPDGGIVLLRLSRQLTRAQAEAYRHALLKALSPPGTP